MGSSDRTYSDYGVSTKWYVDDMLSRVSTDPNITADKLKNKRVVNNTNALRLLEQTEGMTAYSLEGRRYANLYLSDMEELEYLPAVTVYRQLKIYSCPKLVDLSAVKYETDTAYSPEGLVEYASVVDVYISACPSLVKLPRNQIVGSVVLSDCSALEEVPPGKYRNIDLFDCGDIKIGPGVTTSSLSLRGDTNIIELADDFKCTNGLYTRGDVSVSSAIREKFVQKQRPDYRRFSFSFSVWAPKEST